MRSEESTVAALVVLVGRDLRQLVRDRTTVILMFIAPIAAAIIASVSLGAPQQVTIKLATVGNFDTRVMGDIGGLVSLINGQSKKDLELDILTSNQAAVARQRVIDGKDAAALIVPDDGRGPVHLIQNKYVKLSGSGASLAGEAFIAHIRAVQYLRDHHAPLPVANTPVRVETVSVRGHVLDGAELYGPAIAAFFLLLTAGSIARGLQVEREQGTLARLHVMPLHGSAIVLAKFITMLLVTAFEFALVLATMSIVFGARWGNPLALLEVVVALTLAIGALAMLIASFGGSVRRVHYFEIMLALLLGALGGNLVPLQNLPGVAQRIALLTPNGIAIRTMRDIATSSKGPFDILAPVFGILVFAAVAGIFAVLNRRRLIAP